MEQAASYGNIVVAINYRLALFGFFNYYDEEQGTTVGGNYGLMDIQNAIEFIHNNADMLGGDKDLITIDGQSGGAWGVGAVLLHPKTGTLVNAAIAQSGCFLNAFSHVLLKNQTEPDYNKYTDMFCITDECTPETTTAEKWEILKTIPAQELWTPFLDAFIFPGPIPFDGVFYQENAFEKYRRGDLDTSITYVLGINSFEGT